MIKMKHIFYTVIVCCVLQFISCTTQTNDYSCEKVILSDSCINNSKQIVAEEFVSACDLPLAAKHCFAYNDSIIIVVNSKLCERDFVQVLNVNTKEIVASCLSKGNGKNEILVANALLYDNTLVVNDYIKSQFALINLDSLINHGNVYSPKVIKRKFGSMPTIVPFKTDYIVENPYCLTSEKYGIKQGLEYNIPRFIKIDNLENGDYNQDFDYYTRNVAVDGQIIVNPKTNYVMYASLTKSRMELYDDGLKLLKVVDGPILFEDSYTISSEEKDAPKEVCFSDGVPYAYVSHYNSGKFVYLNYLGITMGINSNPMEMKSYILKFDWDGNLLDCYKTGRLLDSFTVNDLTSTMYATTYDSDGNVCVMKMALK